MELFYFKQQKQLDDFIKGVSHLAEVYGAEFLQSWQWGEILEKEGEEILRIGVHQKINQETQNAKMTNGKDETEIFGKDSQVLAAITLVKKKLFGTYCYWYAPRGPIINYQLLNAQENISGSTVKNTLEKNTQDLLKFLFSEIKKINPQALFLRIEPQININNFKIKKTLDGQPAQTLILDLSLGEDQLLRTMHQKTRYNLRLAEKKGVKISEGSLTDLPEFWRLLNVTGERDNFRLHSLKHYENLISGQAETNSLDKNGFIKLFLASYEGVNIAGGLFSFYGDKVTYMHGASDNKFRNLMAPYLLQWTLIKKALAENYKYYDFYGIDEEKWPGVTRFKLGFGGRRVNYAGTYDLIFKSFTYFAYNLFRKLKRLV